VKYPSDAEMGTKVSCAECDEEFVPPKLREKKKNYNVADAEVYDAEEAIEDPDKERKKQRVKAAMHQARRRREEEARSPERPFWGGPELFLLVIAAATALAMPVGFVVAKRFPTQGEAGLMIFAYCGMFLAFGIKMIRSRKRLGG
jgi:hypothetical protein